MIGPLEALLVAGVAAAVGVASLLSETLLGARGRALRGALGLVAAASILALAVRALAQAPDGGALTLAGRLVVDPLAALHDAVISAALCVVISLSEGTSRSRVAGFASLAVAGASLAAHAVDLGLVLVGLELAALAVIPLLVSTGPKGHVTGLRWLMPHALTTALLLLGIALVFGATGVTTLPQLGGRLTAVFTGWGAGNVQKAVEILSLPRVPIGDDAIAHLRDAAVKGMAPAALFLPGILLIIAGLLARLGVVPLHRALVGVYARASPSAGVALDVLVRLAPLVALIRALPGGLNTARLVQAPYGWIVPIVSVALLCLVIAGLAAAREGDPRRLVAWATLHVAGWLLIGLAAAGDYYAHAGVRMASMLPEHYAWGMGSGDGALAGVLLLFLGAAAAVMGVAAALALLGRGQLARGQAGLHGLARRPITALALVVCLASLAGAPGTAGFAGRALVLRYVLEDTNVLLRAAGLVAALSAVGLGIGCLRAMIAALLPATAGAGEAPAGLAARVIVVAAALASTLAGVVDGWGHGPCARAAAGAGLTPGAGRTSWLVERAAAE